MKKSIIVAAIAAAVLSGCGKDEIASLGYSESEKSELRVFIEYCRGNEGLQQPVYYGNIWECSDVELKNMARYYGDQDIFADVTDYPHQQIVDSIIYNR